MWKDLPSNYKLFIIFYILIGNELESFSCGLSILLYEDLRKVIICNTFLSIPIYLQIINYLQFLISKLELTQRALFAELIVTLISIQIM